MDAGKQLAVVKRYGLLNWVFASVYKVFRRSIRYQALRCMTLSQHDVDPRFFEQPEGLEVKFLSATEFAAIPNATHPIPEALLRKRAERNDWSSVVLDGEKIVAYGWYTNSPCPLDDVYAFHFDRRHVYMYDGFTDPSYRGRQLHAYGMAHALRKVTEDGSMGLVSYVEADNFASLRSVARLGYQVFGSCRSVRLFGRDFAWESKACRAHDTYIRPRVGLRE